VGCYFWTIVTVRREIPHFIFLKVGSKRKSLRVSDMTRFNFPSTTKLLEVWWLSNILNAFYVSCSFSMGAGEMRLRHPLSQSPKNRGFKTRDCAGVRCLTQCSYDRRWRTTWTWVQKIQEMVQSPKPTHKDERSKMLGILLNQSIKKYL
jgi:hypothetical protein